MCVCVYMSRRLWSQKRAANSLDLELQVDVSHHVGGWELEPGPLNH